MSNTTGEKFNSRLHLARSQDQYRRGMPQFFAQTFDHSGLGSARPLFSSKSQVSVSDRIVSELTPTPKKVARLAVVLGGVGAVAAAILVNAELIPAMRVYEWNIAAIFILCVICILACSISFALVSEVVRKMAVRSAVHKVELPVAESDMLISLKPQRHVVRRFLAQDGTRSNLG